MSILYSFLIKKMPLGLVYCFPLATLIIFEIHLLTRVILDAAGPRPSIEQTSFSTTLSAGHRFSGIGIQQTGAGYRSHFLNRSIN